MAQGSNPKDRILQSASRLFFQQGYTATGINQVLAEAKVAKASLYMHYGSKEELGIAYLKNAREEWFQALNRFIGNKTGLNSVLACFDFLAYNLTNNNFKGCRFLNLLAEVSDYAPMRNEIVEHKTKVRLFIRTIILELVQDRNKAHSLSDTIYLLFEGALTESKVYGDLWPVTSAKKVVKNMIEAEL